jgi:3',5'-cyclic AMP phosphodiesterase CpdA
MARIAHISDLHLVEDEHQLRRGVARLRLDYLSLGRILDAEERRRRVLKVLRQVHESEIDHTVVSGDLTEDGTDRQFEVLSEVLDQAAVDPARITLVPGNHDAYADGEAWLRALAGPLARFARTSSPGAVTLVGDAAILAISTSVAQPLLLAQGAIDGLQRNVLERALLCHRGGERTLVMVQHHAPMRRPGAMQWLDGLRDHQYISALLARNDHAVVLHGHTHRSSDCALRGQTHPRVFSAPAVVDSDEPLRLYETDGGTLRPLALMELRMRTCAA